MMLIVVTSIIHRIYLVLNQIVISFVELKGREYHIAAAAHKTAQIDILQPLKLY